MDFLSRESKVG